MKTIRNTSERLNAKTLDQMFINLVEHGYDCPPFVSNAILETAKSVFSPDQSNPDILNVGQIKILGISSLERGSISISSTFKHSVAFSNFPATYES